MEQCRPQMPKAVRRRERNGVQRLTYVLRQRHGVPDVLRVPLHDYATVQHRPAVHVQPQHTDLHEGMRRDDDNGVLGPTNVPTGFGTMRTEVFLPVLGLPQLCR